MSYDLPVLTLAYLGDSIYEIYIRKFLITKGVLKVKELQTQATSYVSAKAQAQYIKDMLEHDFLLEEEIEIVKRARNHKGSRHPKNTDIVTYKYATGLEALIGYLYLDGRLQRIEEIMEWIIGEDYVCVW